MTPRCIGSAVATALLALGLASSAHAASLTLTPDRATYAVGDTITLSVVGDSGGAAAFGIFGELHFDPTLATALSATQQALMQGSTAWVLGVTPVQTGVAIAFNQINGSITGPSTVDNLLQSTVLLSADAVGSLGFSWATTPASQALDFFGLTNAPGATVRIVGGVVPEPTGAAVFGAGLLVLAWAGRRRP